MRITENTVVNNLLDRISDTRSRVTQLQQQLSTGKRVNTMSDDPAGGETILRYKSAIQKNTQFKNNADSGSEIMNDTSSALDSFGNLVIDLKSILTAANNASRSNSLDSYGKQVNELLKSMIELANTNSQGKYIFGGTQTQDPPYTLSFDESTVTSNPNGIDGAIKLDMGEGTREQVNITGQQAFNGTQMFSTIIQIRDTLLANNAPTTAQLQSVDDFMNHIMAVSSQAGSMVNRFDLLSSQLDTENSRMTSLLSNTQDTDVAQAGIQLSQDQTILDAAMGSGANIIQKSLINFLMGTG